MAKEPTTPKAKATKPVKTGGIAKRTPVKASPAKASPARISLAIIDKDVIFLWKCIKTSSMKIDWNAVAKETGKSTSTLQKQFSRLNQKLEKNVKVAAPDASSDKDANEDVMVGASKDSD
ncbi:hypothetical protein DTO013E5_3335 [Penicillium roqueforti]|nr:hypothetical protein CBS147337_2352 [Penicillium roqueforti]KAI2678156.1 hypothetical protein CBS147355_5157 [Penicillium roqueforti]KAI2686495.1 hypothetical protein LCP963914a_4095 [Penicillium roqueforti]KAI2715444.1 hypothetical protein CBS147318_6044 [Penicillium roqueforti]KAI2729408.1 hypothetical protein CBS147354_1856 [Penicillium roqueforti]